MRVSADGYRSLLEDMVREAKRLAGILAIYMDEITFGHSISQIKLLVVYDAETCDEYNLKFDEVIRIIGTRNILDESYISVDAKLLENIVKFDCLLQPQWVMGRKVSVQAPPTSEMRFFNISRVLDLLAAGFLYDFFRWEVERNVRTRDALWTLKRLRRLLDLTKVVLRREQFPRWDAYMDTVFTMCDSWFDLGIERYRMLMDSLREGFCILLELIDELRPLFRESADRQPPPRQERPDARGPAGHRPPHHHLHQRLDPRGRAAADAGLPQDAGPVRHRPARQFVTTTIRIRQGQAPLRALRRLLLRRRRPLRQHGAELYLLGARQGPQPLPGVQEPSGPAARRRDHLRLQHPQRLHPGQSRQRHELPKEPRPPQAPPTRVPRRRGHRRGVWVRWDVILTPCAKRHD